MRVLGSGQADPYHHLALEELLLDEAGASPRTLLLWTGEASVVIGKNQNPWRECALSRMQAQGVKLARRISGGGAVYHDPGNLNISLFLPRTEYKTDILFDLLADALASLGLKAVRAGHNSLYVGDRKVSGHAFCFRRGGALHHATLLVNADLELMNGCLTRNEELFGSKGIASVPAEVANLADLQQGLSMEQVVRSVCNAVGSDGPERADAAEGVDAQALAETTARMKTWEWCYGMTPTFELQLPAPAKLTVRRGLIESAVELPEEWVGTRFEPAVVASYLETMGEDFLPVSRTLLEM